MAEAPEYSSSSDDTELNAPKTHKMEGRENIVLSSNEVWENEAEARRIIYTLATRFTECLVGIAQWPESGETVKEICTADVKITTVAPGQGPPVVMNGRGEVCDQLELSMAGTGKTVRQGNTTQQWSKVVSANPELFTMRSEPKRVRDEPGVDFTCVGETTFKTTGAVSMTVSETLKLSFRTEVADGEPKLKLCRALVTMGNMAVNMEACPCC